MSWWHYLLLVNFYLVLFFGFYVLLLRRETFFQLNRIYLVAASLLSFFIPLIQSEWVKNLFITQQVQQTIYSPVMAYNITFAPTQDVLTIGEVLNVLYISVTLFLIVRLIWQLIVLKKAIEKPEPSAAYSFFKKISLGKDLANRDVIAAHEQVHAKQWHSVDVMIIETVMIINWFNPVVYLYRFAIKFIHEFIADRDVVQAGTDKADYALLLLSQTFEVETHKLAIPFYNHSLLKERILMLQKSRSQRIALAKYGLSAPLFALMLIFSSATVSNSKVVKAINKNTEIVFDKPATESLDFVSSNAELPPQPVITPGINEPMSEIRIDNPAGGNTDDGTDEVKVDTIPSVDKKVYTAVENQPQFPGGMSKLYQFIGAVVRYPAEDKANKVQGRVFITFVIETDGSLTEVKALRGPTQTLMDEATRVMNTSPKWVPGYQNGRPVRVQYTIPLNFTLDQPTPLTITSEVPKSATDKPLVEIMPTFPGGQDKFYEFISENIRYPEKMKTKKIQGKAFIEFVVEDDGALSNFRILREPGYGAGEEAIRVLSLSPKWRPAIKNGEAVRVKYTVPINFSLGANSLQGNLPVRVQGYGLNTNPLQRRPIYFALSGNFNGVKPARSLLSSTQRYLTDSARKYGNNNGGPIRVDIRGIHNLTGGSEDPLFVVDGVEKDKAYFESIDQNSISSVSVLKDQSAMAWGDKGKNGVIVILTKEYVKEFKSKPKN